MSRAKGGEAESKSEAKPAGRVDSKADAKAPVVARGASAKGSVYSPTTIQTMTTMVMLWATWW